MNREATVYDVVGGGAFFASLCAAFYGRVEQSAILRPLYPDDLTESRRALGGFLAQYFGGPPDYSAERGHPRLRMRHAHLRIGPAERDAWYDAMAAALDETLPLALAGRAGEGDAVRGDALRSAMLEYFARSADWMMNVE